MQNTGDVSGGGHDSVLGLPGQHKMRNSFRYNTTNSGGHGHYNLGYHNQAGGIFYTNFTKKKIKKPGLSPQSAVFTVQNGHFSSMHFLHNILYTCTVLCKCTELFSCKIFSPCPRLSPPASTISAGRRSQSPNITRKTSKGLEKFLRKL